MASNPGDVDRALAPTVSETAAGTDIDSTRPIDASPLRTLAFDERYTPTTSLGQGGMGIVTSVRDEQIGREIAIKRLLSSRRDNASVRARFLREARVQAQLEHPSIVPVYDLGIDAEGDAWFTMKKVRGVTLAEVIGGLRAHDPAYTSKYTRRRLLSAFASVCLAIDFAHARGIVHRDLKPENVMLGDFGEVYVLDWGIAKIAGVSDAELAVAERHEAADANQTAIGEVLGTVGYMPAEQLTGASTVGATSDVWALGAILFELLALQPLYPRMSLGQALLAVGEPVERKPSVRAPRQSVPPELDVVCERATADEIGERYRSARALHDDVAQYLDHDLEGERRRERAAAHLERAREAERSARDGGPGMHDARTTAMQEVNKALALDPTNEQAKHAMVRMLVEPPASLPADARAELDQTRVDETKLGFRVGAFGFLSMYLFLPVYLWMGIRDWTVTGCVLALIATSAGLLYWGSRAPERARLAMQLTIVSAGLLIALLARVDGPFGTSPLLAFLMAIGLVFNRQGLGVGSVIALLAISLGLPLLLEVTGAITPSYVFEHGHIMLVPHMTNLAPVPTMIAMTMTCVSTIALGAFFLVRVHALLRTTQDQLWGYSWNLRQFLPPLTPLPSGRMPSSPLLTR